MDPIYMLVYIQNAKTPQRWRQAIGGIATGLGHAHGADQCEGRTGSFTGPTLWALLNERKEKNHAKQLREAIDASRRIDGYFYVVSLVAHAATNINLAVASNFFGIPPDNSAITDIINAFQMENPGNTVTAVDNGATATLEANIIAGNTRGVDLFLAADSETPQDLLVNHFSLVTTYNNSTTPPLYTFNYAQGVLALLSNTRWIDVSCATGTCGYDPIKFANIEVGIADPSLAPYGVAAQSVLTGRYGLMPPLCMSTTTNGNPKVSSHVTRI